MKDRFHAVLASGMCIMYLMSLVAGVASHNTMGQDRTHKMGNMGRNVLEQCASYDLESEQCKQWYYTHPQGKRPVKISRSSLFVSVLNASTV